MAIPTNDSSPYGNLATLPHDSKQANIIACTIITWLIGALFVAARFYTKTVINSARLGASEWCVFTAMVLSLATSICEILEVQNGMGAHIWDLAPGDTNLITIDESQWISILFYSLSLTFTKLSILLLYINIFFHTWIRPVSYAILSVVALSQVWVCYVIFSACTPLAAFWDMSITPAVCHPQAYWLSNQYLLIATDFLTFVLPLPVVWGLKVRFQQKCLLIFLFALGFFVCTISIIRIVILTPVLASPGNDPTYGANNIFYWTGVEINAAIVVASAITLKPFISRFMPNLLSSHPYKDAGGAAGSTALIDPRGGRRSGATATFGSAPLPALSVTAGSKRMRADSRFDADLSAKREGTVSEEEMVGLGATARDFSPPHSAKPSVSTLEG